MLPERRQQGWLESSLVASLLAVETRCCAGFGEMAKDVTDRIDQVQTIKAATALLKHLEVQRSKKKTLIDDDDSEIIQLVVALKKIPKSSQTKPIRMYDLLYCLHR